MNSGYLFGWRVATNSVLDTANIVLKNINESKLKSSIEKYNENKEYKIYYKKQQEGRTSSGKLVHGAS